jgi:hypothetical protein
MHIKRIIVLTLIVILLLSLAGCKTTTTTVTVPTTIKETTTLPVITTTVFNTTTITSPVTITTTATSPVTTILPAVTSTITKTTTSIFNKTETVFNTITEVVVKTTTEIHIITITVTTTYIPSPCLPMGTLIDTPDGPVPVEQLHKGMMVWTMTGSGDRVASVLVETSKIQVPPTHQVVVIMLEDGRTVTASLDHPTANGKALGDYRAGDILDGSRVIVAERMSYSGGATYDILPDSATGFYWANGILLSSTLK